MAHELESGFYGDRKPAWHGLGTVIEEDVVTAAEAIKLAGLDWSVELVPTYARDPRPVYEGDDGSNFMVIENKWGVQRNTDGKVLGIVSEKYSPVQNQEAFTFVDSIVDDGAAKYHTAGALYGGRQVWLLAKLGEDILINGMEEERIQPFLLLSNSHDGSKALTVALTPIRVVCANTLNFALGTTKRMWKTRHLKGSTENFREARATLELSFKYLGEFEQLATDLINTKMDAYDFGKLTAHLFPYNKDEDSPSKITRAEGSRADCLTIFSNAENLANVRGTAWAAINAIGEYSDWNTTVRTTKMQTETDGRFKRTLDADLKDKALSFIESQVGVGA